MIGSVFMHPDLPELIEARVDEFGASFWDPVATLATNAFRWVSSGYTQSAWISAQTIHDVQAYPLTPVNTEIKGFLPDAPPRKNDMHEPGVIRFQWVCLPLIKQHSQHYVWDLPVLHVFDDDYYARRVIEETRVEHGFCGPVLPWSTRKLKKLGLPTPERQ